MILITTVCWLSDNYKTRSISSNLNDYIIIRLYLTFRCNFLLKEVSIKLVQSLPARTNWIILATSFLNEGLWPKHAIIGCLSEMLSILKKFWKKKDYLITTKQHQKLAFCYYYISALVLTCFRLTKGRATFFRPETIVASFLHLMVLFLKVLFNCN